MFEALRAQEEAVANNKAHTGRSEIFVRQARRDAGGLCAFLWSRSCFGGRRGSSSVLENAGEKGFRSPNAIGLFLSRDPERFPKPATGPTARNGFAGNPIVVCPSQRQPGRDS
jgi:hypothetical protein